MEDGTPVYGIEHCDGLLTFYLPNGRRLEVRGTYGRYSFTQIGYTPITYGVITGTVLFEEEVVSFELHFQGDQGTIKRLALDSYREWQVLRYCAAYAVVVDCFGEEDVLIRNLDYPWDPTSEILMGYRCEKMCRLHLKPICGLPPP